MAILLSTAIAISGLVDAQVQAVAASAAAAPIASGSTAPVPNPEKKLAPSKLGVFRGSGQVDEVRAYEKWLGAPVSYAIDYVGKGSDWAKIDDPTWWCKSWASTEYQLVLAVAILPNGNETLKKGAAGAYNAHWRRFARTMVANGCSDAVLRLGWEFNCCTWPWRIKGREAAYAAYWREIVTTMRSVPGQQFTYDWNPLGANHGDGDVEAAYPGNDIVDVIGLDAYDATAASNNPAKRWQDIVNGKKYGLQWQLDFAIAKGKPVSYPEWGLSLRSPRSDGAKPWQGTDNPYYIKHMYQWLVNLPASGPGSLRYASYFEYTAEQSDHRLMTGNNPRSARAFRNLFGAGGSKANSKKTFRFQGKVRADESAFFKRQLTKKAKVRYRLKGTACARANLRVVGGKRRTLHSFRGRVLPRSGTFTTAKAGKLRFRVTNRCHAKKMKIALVVRVPARALR